MQHYGLSLLHNPIFWCGLMSDVMSELLIIQYYHSQMQSDHIILSNDVATTGINNPYSTKILSKHWGHKRAHAPTCHIIASINWYFIPISHFYCALELLIRFPNLTWMTLTYFPVSLSHTVWFRKSLIQCLYLFGSIYFIYCSLFQCDSFRGSSPKHSHGPGRFADYFLKVNINFVTSRYLSKD